MIGKASCLNERDKRTLLILRILFGQATPRMGFRGRHKKGQSMAEENKQCILHSDMLTRMDERVKEMHKWTFGNGQPGAAGRLVALETTVNALSKPRQWPAVVSAICAVTAVVIGLILK